MRKRNWIGWLGSLLCMLSLFGLALSVTTLVTPQQAQAQDEEEEGGDPEEGGGEEEAPAGGGAAAANPDPGSDDTSSADETSLLGWAFDALGWSYSIIFLALSFSMVALFVMNLLQARRENVVPVDLVETFEAHLNEKRYQEAYELAKNDESFLGQVLSAGLAKLKEGYSQAIEAMQEVGEEENMKLDHRLSYLALIGTISPMIGLFGTVHGMIDSFQVIATATTGAPKPAELAAGISTALFTTLVGLFIAIPSISAYSILRNRVARLVLEVGIISEGLMGRFQNMGGAKKA